MTDINVRDKLYQAVSEYNQVVVREKHSSISNDARRGIFYTILRRYFDIGKNRGGAHIIRPEDLTCEFRENGEIKTCRISRSFGSPHNSYYSWEESEIVKKAARLKNVLMEKSELFRTPEMNEIADIVQSIK